MNRWLGLGLLLAVAIALALRCPGLGLRPVHNDEATNGSKLRALWEKGSYVYDPHEFHGPALYYLALPFVWLSPAHSFEDLSENTLRSVTIFFGVALIALLALVVDGLGRGAALGAAMLTAISPAMVFYSRYFIHEMLLVFFTAVVIAAGWRRFQTGRIGWALLCGASLGLMHATKETFVINLGAMGLAAVLTALFARWRDGVSARLRALWNPRHALVAFGAAAAVSVVMFSSFFANLHGLLDSVQTYLPWLRRAEGQSPHVHPWCFYFERLAFFHRTEGPIWSEGLILILSAVGAATALMGKGLAPTRLSLARFLTFYTALLTIAYTVIPYKTPWCLLSFLHGMILLAGIGVVALVRLWKPIWIQMCVGALLLAAAAQLAWQAWALNLLYFADRRNPYVYAQTVPDILRLVRTAEALAQIAPQGHEMIVKVMAPDSDYWPLPWYLRSFKRVGWWDRVPEDPYAPLMIVSAKLNAALDEKSNRRWLMVGLFEMRPGVFFEFYVESGLWRKYVQTLPRQSY
jgi:uncharacterized protein (TIGR03663 family)